MNTRRSTTRWEDIGIANERIPPCVDQVTIVFLQGENEEFPLQEPQVPPEPQEPEVPQVPPMPQGPQFRFVEGDMTNAKLRDDLMNLTQLIMAQSHVVNNHFVAQANQGGGLQPHASTLASRIHNFMRMNPPTFHGTKVDEDPQSLINEVFKVVNAIGVTPQEKGI